MQVWAAFVWTKPYPVFPALLLLDLYFSNPTRLPPPPTPHPHFSISARRSIGCKQNKFKINLDCAKFYFYRLIFQPLFKFYTSFTVISLILRKSSRHQRNQLPPESRITTNG